jgi:YVTN family beta-propeller protein
VTNSGNYNDPGNTVSVIDTVTNTVTATVHVGITPLGVAITPDGKKVYVTNAESDNVSVIDTATNKVIATVNSGKYTINYPTGVAIGPIIYTNMTGQSTRTASNATEDIGVEETEFSSSEEKKAVEFNNSNNNNSESDNGNSPGENDSSKNISTPGFLLFESLICLYGGWKFSKK